MNCLWRKDCIEGSLQADERFLRSSKILFKESNNDKHIDNGTRES